MLLFWGGVTMLNEILEEYDALFGGQNVMCIEGDNVTEGRHDACGGYSTCWGETVCFWGREWGGRNAVFWGGHDTMNFQSGLLRGEYVLL